MVATRPDQVIEVFTSYFNAGDLEGLTTAYEADATLLPDPAQPAVSGVAAIRDVWQQFVAMGGALSILSVTALECGDLALTHTSWRFDAPGSDAMEGVGAEVCRRQPDGTWRYVIDNPWGAGLLAAAAAR